MGWWVVAVLEAVWIVGVAIWVATDRRAPASTLAWIVTLAFLPFLGVPIYWLVGPRHLRRKQIRYRGLKAGVAAAYSEADPRRAISPDMARQVRLATRLDEAPLSTALALTQFHSGSEAFSAIEHALADAHHHAHLEFYIWNDDATGRRVRDLLVERARAGIQVRVLVDSVGTRVRRRFFRDLLLAGGEFARFNPPRLGMRSRLLNFRSHRKIVVIDGRTGFLGGMNVCDEQTVGKGRERPWRDTLLRVEGEAVRWLQRSFLENWQFTLPAPLTMQAEFFPAQPRGEHLVADRPLGARSRRLSDPRVLLHRHRRRRRAHLDHLSLPRSGRGHAHRAALGRAPRHRRAPAGAAARRLPAHRRRGALLL